LGLDCEEDMVGEWAEGDSPNTSPQTDQADTPAQAQSGEVAEALERVQEAVIDVKEGGLPESLEAAIEAIDSAVREVPDKPETDQLKAVADALEGALEEVEKGKVANLLPVLEQAQSIVESGLPSSES
jgi:phage-related minor tail protein